MEDVSRTIVNRYLVSLFTTGFSCITVGAGFVRSRKQMFSRYHMSFCLNKGILGGETSNIFYFHPENWGR